MLLDLLQRGVRTDPCGTPVTEFFLEDIWSLSICLVCVRSAKYDENHSHNTSVAMMLQFVSQSSMIYSIKRSLKIVKNGVKRDM